MQGVQTLPTSSWYSFQSFFYYTNMRLTASVNKPSSTHMLNSQYVPYSGKHWWFKMQQICIFTVFIVSTPIIFLQ